MALSSYVDIETLGIKLEKRKCDFNILSLNADSLASKMNLIRAAIYSLMSKKVIISAIAIQECYFGDKLTLVDMEINGYTLFPQASNLGRKGGLAIYVHESYTAKVRTPLCFKGADWEALFVDISSEFMKKTVTLGNIYRPGRQNSKAQLEAFSSKLNSIIKAMGTPGKYQVLVGDTNFDLIKVNQPDTQMVRKFYEDMTEKAFFPQITLPTRIGKTSATLLDHIWLRSPPAVHTPIQAIGSYILTDKISDHMACVCSFDIQNPKFELPKFVEKRDLSERNLHRFAYDFSRQNVIEKIGRNLETDANKSYETFYEKFSETRDRYMPKVKKNFNRKHHKIHPWLSDSILKSINKKNKLYVEMVKCPRGSPAREKKKEAFESYNVILMKLIRQQKRLHYNNQFKQNSDNIKATWKTIKDILHKNRKSNHNPSTFIDKEQEFTTPQSIADGLNNFFTSVGLDLANSINTEGMPDFSSYLGDPRPERFNFQYTDSDKIEKYIKNMKSKSSSGDDEISSIFLKNESVIRALTPCLTVLINQSLCTGIFPTRLKLAKVIPLYKDKGDDFRFENYRPISLLSAISKIYERVVFDQIYDYLQSTKLFYSNQYGFRRKHSTETAGLELFDRALKDVDEKNDPFAIFLDLSKAFDTIDHSILLKKLKHYGIRGTALLWFESYLTDRVQYVFYENSKSKPMKISTGVPQGSILGPLLFLICINDIKKCTDLFEVIGYADDTTLFGTLRKIAAATPRGGNIIKTTNDELEKVNVWLKVNKLSLNPSKTRFMIFHHHQRKTTAVRLGKFEGGNDRICIDKVPIK